MNNLNNHPSATGGGGAGAGEERLTAEIFMMLQRDDPSSELHRDVVNAVMHDPAPPQEFADEQRQFQHHQHMHQLQLLQQQQMLQEQQERQRLQQQQQHRVQPPNLWAQQQQQQQQQQSPPRYHHDPLHYSYHQQQQQQPPVVELPQYALAAAAPQKNPPTPTSKKASSPPKKKKRTTKKQPPKPKEKNTPSPRKQQLPTAAAASVAAAGTTPMTNGVVGVVADAAEAVATAAAATAAALAERMSIVVPQGPPGKYAVGTLVTKYFFGFGWYQGRIIHYDYKTKLYKVQYEDNDMEDMDEDDLTTLLDRHKMEKRKTRSTYEVGTLVKKFFYAFGWFEGTIEFYDEETEMYHVLYEDGDTEELEQDEVYDILLDAHKKPKFSKEEREEYLRATCDPMQTFWLEQ